jgi:hypothetical protein
VRIADTVDEFVAAVGHALDDDPVACRLAADAFLTHLSWDGTWRQMREAIEQAIADRQPGNAARKIS